MERVKEIKNIRRDECPVCQESNSKPVSPNGNFRRCVSCGLLYRQKARFLIPEVGWDIKYYERPEILHLHEERKSLFEHIIVLGGRIKHGGQWLDVGCGIGMLLSIACKAGWEVSGIDPSQSALKIANKRVPNSNLFNITSVAQLPPERMYDVISIIDVLRCIEKPYEEIEAIFKRLNPGGKIIIRETNSIYFAFYRKKRGDKVDIEVTEYLQEWDARSLKKMLLRAGFERAIVRSSPVFTESSSAHDKKYVKVLKKVYKFINTIGAEIFNSLCLSPNLIAIGYKEKTK